MRRGYHAPHGRQETRERGLRQHQLHAYANYHEILARRDIDAVACATPDHWHAIIILDTCKAGKDMYCEKPLVNNLVEAKTVMDVVGKSKIIFQVGSQQRADREFRYACELLHNGHLGRIKQVLVGVGGPPKPCNLPGEELEPGLDWDRWQGPAPARALVRSSAARRARSFSLVANLLRVRRRRHDRLGRTPLRHRPMGIGHG